MKTVTTTTSMKRGTSGRKGGKYSKKRIVPTVKIKCAMIAHFIFCSIKTHPKSISRSNYFYFCTSDWSCGDNNICDFRYIPC